MSKRIMRLLAVALVALLVNANLAYAATSTVTPPASSTTTSDPALQNGTDNQTVEQEKDDEHDVENEQEAPEQEDEIDASLKDQADSIKEVDEDLGDGVQVTAPQDGSVTNDATIDISGMAKEGYTVIVKVENAAGEQTLTVPVNADGTFNLADLPLEPGKNSVEVQVYDANGNKVGEVEKRIVKPGAAMAKLSDVKDSWAKDTIAKLMALGIVNGTADGSFKPSDDVEGAQFVKMLALAANLQVDGQQMKGFADLPDGFWASNYIAAAESKGIVKGDDDKAFDPTQPLTRAQMAVLLIRALGLEDKAEALADKSASSFTDAASVPEWAQGAVELAAQLGLIKGMADGSFQPNLPADRAQAAALIARFLNLKETVNPSQPATPTAPTTTVTP